MNGQRKTLWIGHIHRHRIINITYKLVNEEPLRIGAGKAKTPGELIDLPILLINKDGKPTPVIPGSSLKGVFRSFMDIYIMEATHASHPAKQHA